MREENWGSDNQKQVRQDGPTARQRRRTARNVWRWRIRDVWTQERGPLIILALALYFVLGRAKRFVMFYIPWLLRIYAFPMPLILSCVGAFLLMLYICGSPTLSKRLEQLKRFVYEFRYGIHPLRRNIDSLWNYAAPALCFLTSLKAWYELFSTDFFGVDSFELWAWMLVLPIPDIEALLWAAISLFLWWRSGKTRIPQWQRLANAGRILSIIAIVAACTPANDVLSFVAHAFRSA